MRYRHGKDDSLDAEGAARSVLSGEANAQPKTQSGSVEMIRQIKLTRDTAVKSRSLAMITLKTLIINAPSALREQLDQIRGSITLVKHIAQFHIKELVSTTDSAKTSMRTLARRWLMLNEEVCDLDRQLKSLVEEKAPTLLASHGISTMTIAEMLILAGDDPTRIKSEAALAKLCGVCPIPASSGVKHRFRLNRGGNRQANAALYRVAIVRMRSHKPTLDYVKKRTKDGKSKSEIIRCLKRFIVREIYQHICRQNPC